MIDIEGRRVFAQALRQLLSGAITNIEFDGLDLESSDDPGIFAIWKSTWVCYDDFAVHRLRLTDGQILDFKRCILFLHSDLEYEWTESESTLKRVEVSVRRLLARLTGNSLPDPTPDLDFQYWPFARFSDYQEALDSPRLLSVTDSEQDAAPQIRPRL